MSSDVVASVGKKFVALVHAARDAFDYGAMDNQDIVDVDEEGELGAVRERRDVGALQLHRQLFVGLRSLKRALAVFGFNHISFYPGPILTQRQPMIIHHGTSWGVT